MPRRSVREDPKIVGIDKITWSRVKGRMLSPEQSRSARAWLDWSQEDLAKKANVSMSTIRDFEKKRRVPIANNLEAIGRVLEAEGVELLQDADGKPVGISVKPKG